MKPPRNMTAAGEHAVKAGRIETIQVRPCFRCGNPAEHVIGKIDLDLAGIAVCKKHLEEAQFDLWITMLDDEKHFERKYFGKKSRRRVNKGKT